MYYVNIVVDQEGIYQQNNTPCYKGRIVREWFEEYFTDSCLDLQIHPRLIQYSIYGPI